MDIKDMIMKEHNYASLILLATVIAVFFGTAIITTACNPDQSEMALETEIVDTANQSVSTTESLSETTAGTTVPTNGNPTSGTTSGTTTGTTSGVTTSNNPVTPTTETTTVATTESITEATTTTTTEATTVETTTEATTTTTEATTVETTVETTPTTTAAYRTGVDVKIHIEYITDWESGASEERWYTVHNVDPNVNWGASDTKAENALVAEYGLDRDAISDIHEKIVVATYWSDGSVT